MRRLAALALALVLVSGCSAPPAGEDGTTRILCATYPIYLFTTAAVGDAPGVEVALLVDQQTSCLHDYTLTIADMRAIETADVIVVNGAGLEAFMADALARAHVPVVDCSQCVTLLPSLDHAQGAEEEPDPHYWMDPRRALVCVDYIARQLSALDAAPAGGFTPSLPEEEVDRLLARLDSREGLDRLPGLITFHDGFQYLADALGLELLASIEEEEGAEASAKELAELVELVERSGVPAIFVERNGSRRSAQVIAGETGCAVYELDLIMSGEGRGLEPYLQAVARDLDTLGEALG